MALGSVTAGGDYYEFDSLCNEGAVVLFKIRAHEPTIQLENGPVDPIRVDFRILSGSQAGRVVRGERVIKGCILQPLRSAAVGDDRVARMAWVKIKGRTQSYVGANPVTAEELARVEQLFKDTNGDPYTAAELAANPTANLASVQGAPAAPPVEPPAPPAPAVGGPAGPQWGEAPAAVSNGQPVSAAAW